MAMMASITEDEGRQGPLSQFQIANCKFQIGNLHFAICNFADP
jgi:hypothetical protein